VEKEKKRKKIRRRHCRISSATPREKNGEKTWGNAGLRYCELVRYKKEKSFYEADTALSEGAPAAKKKKKVLQASSFTALRG